MSERSFIARYVNYGRAENQLKQLILIGQISEAARDLVDEVELNPVSFGPISDVYCIAYAVSNMGYAEWLFEERLKPKLDSAKEKVKPLAIPRKQLEKIRRPDGSYPTLDMQRLIHSILSDEYHGRLPSDDAVVLDDNHGLEIRVR